MQYIQNITKQQNKGTGSILLCGGGFLLFTHNWPNEEDMTLCGANFHAPLMKFDSIKN